MSRAKYYDKYLASSRWKTRKRKYYATHDKACRACGSKQLIHLHHKTYTRLGKERDQDLVPLCSKCHNGLHDLQRSTGQSLWTCTEDFIRAKRNIARRKSTVKKDVRKNATRRKILLSSTKSRRY